MLVLFDEWFTRLNVYIMFCTDVDDTTKFTMNRSTYSCFHITEDLPVSAEQREKVLIAAALTICNAFPSS